MKKIAAIIPFLLWGFVVVAQQVSVSGGGQVVLNAGSQMSFNGLTLNPSSSVTLTGATIQRNATVNNPFGNPYVSRVYFVTPTPFVFNGSIRFEYDDTELNGLDEATLQVINNNGTMWQLAGTSVSDPANNVVDATGLSNLTIGELILANNLALPLQWVAVTAQRKQGSILIKWITEQEVQVSHFDVERSSNGLDWNTTIPGVPAGNQLHRREYQQTDQSGGSGQLFYRIRQTDMDGRYTLSRTVIVPPELASYQIRILPNPASTYFMIAGSFVSKVQEVYLFNSSGLLMKSWKGYQNAYQLPALSKGTYHVRVKTSDGMIVTNQLVLFP